MSPNIIYPEWRNVNENRKYPFKDDATMKSTTGEEWPMAALLDARLYPVGGNEDQYISSVEITTTLATIWISDTVKTLCSGSFDPSSPASVVPMEDAYGRPAGVLVADPQQLLLVGNWGAGRTITFKANATAFAAAAVVPMPQLGVRGFLVGDTLFAEDVVFVAGPGVIFRDEDDVIRVDVVGDAFINRRNCQEIDEAFPEQSCFKTLNDLEPDPQGNITIMPGTANEDNVLRVEPADNGIKIYLAGGK